MAAKRKLESTFEYDPGTLSEINHDVLFREGQTHKGEVTYTPRLLLVDLKGSLGSLQEAGRLYEPPPAPDLSLPLWPPDKVSVQSHPTEPKNEFQQDLEQGEIAASTLPNSLKESGLAVPKLYHLENSVKTWSDFLRPHLHPRSINIIQEYQHGNSSHPFDTFPQGQALWSQARFNEEFTDRIRLYLEETDNLQGFQVLLDSYNGFAGLACGNLQHLRDEYPSKSVLCVASQPPLVPQTTVKQDSVRVLNQALAFSTLAGLSSLFMPVSGSTHAWRDLGLPVTLPNLTYKPDSYYHSSALVASALDTTTLVYRLRSSLDCMGDVTTRFSVNSRMAVGLSLALPFCLKTDGMLLETLEGWAGPLTRSLTPYHIDSSSQQWLQSLVLRGVPENRLMRTEQRDMGSSNPAYSCRTLAQLLKTYLSFMGQSSGITQVTTCDSPLNTTAPFPHIFSENITSDGHLDTKPRAAQYGVNQVPVLAGLHSNESLGPLLESLHSEAKQINIRTLHQFANSGLESTDLSESLESLLCLSECYSDNQVIF